MEKTSAPRVSPASMSVVPVVLGLLLISNLFSVPRASLISSQPWKIELFSSLVLLGLALFVAAKNGKQGISLGRPAVMVISLISAFTLWSGSFGVMGGVSTVYCPSHSRVGDLLVLFCPFSLPAPNRQRRFVHWTGFLLGFGHRLLFKCFRFPKYHGFLSFRRPDPHTIRNTCRGNGPFIADNYGLFFIHSRETK